MAVPDAITDLVAEPGFSQVILSWTEPPNGGSPITDYIVEYTTNQSDEEWNTFDHPASTLSNITVTGLENNLTTYFRVSAVNSEGTASSSNVADAMPQNAPAPEYCSRS